MAAEHFRLLAAIMFADMVGYSALMQEDEEKAMEDRDHQREILEECILKHQGRVIQYYGDGTLSIFGSAIRAVECAVEIQKKLSVPPEVPLRIGLHVGDIVYDDEGAYGDAVNLAARIQSLASPGSVLVSDRLYEELRNHPKIRTRFLGTHELKNIKRSVSVYGISNKGLPVPSLAEILVQTGGARRSIAVLPFVNMSADPSNEYFSDGITEEIINALTKVGGLEVTSRTSAFAFKGLSKDIREIGRELSAQYVLEGSVRKVENSVRITAQLIDTHDGFHIWSEVFDRDLKDIFRVQDEISRKIAAKLKEDFSDAQLEIDRLVEPTTKDVDAYNQFLKGKYHWHKWTPESAQKSIEHYERAIKQCPEYAEAYAGIANCYTFLGAIGRLPPQRAYPKAEQAAKKSIELNDRLADSHVALAFVKLFYYWDFKGAKKSFRRALAIKPDSPSVKQAYALYLKIRGKNRGAIRLLKEALDQDPLSLTLNADLARAYLNAGRPEEALDQFNRTLELDGDFRTAIEGKGWSYVALGEYEQARKVFENYQHSTGHHLKGVTQLGYIHGKLGNMEEANRYLELLKTREQTEDEISLAMDYAVIYLGLRDYYHVFDYLHRAVKERLGGVLFIKSNPIWEEIKLHPRYDELINQIGLNEDEKEPKEEEFKL